MPFGDGFVRDVDMADELNGEVFEPLRDVDVFREVVLDPETEVPTWPNGVDLAPEFLSWGRHKAHGCECGYDSPRELDTPAE